MTSTALDPLEWLLVGPVCAGHPANGILDRRDLCLDLLLTAIDSTFPAAEARIHDEFADRVVHGLLATALHADDTALLFCVLAMTPSVAAVRDYFRAHARDPARVDRFLVRMSRNLALCVAGLATGGRRCSTGDERAFTSLTQFVMQCRYDWMVA